MSATSGRPGLPATGVADDDSAQRAPEREASEQLGSPHRRAPQPPRLRLVRPRAILTYACLTPEQRGETS